MTEDELREQMTVAGCRCDPTYVGFDGEHGWVFQHGPGCPLPKLARRRAAARWN